MGRLAFIHRLVDASCLAVLVVIEVSPLANIRLINRLLAASVHVVDLDTATQGELTSLPRIE